MTNAKVRSTNGIRVSDFFGHGCLGLASFRQNMLVQPRQRFEVTLWQSVPNCVP